MKLSRPPGRPLAFDPTLALHQAMALFWQRGYADASIQALTETMGINRPSLYAAFGDKEALFLKVIEAYRLQVETGIAERFAQDLSLTQTLQGLFEDAIALYTQPVDSPRGCLLASAATAEAAQSATLRDAVGHALLSIEAQIRQGLAAKLSGAPSGCGESARRLDSMTLLAASFCYALSVRARLGVHEARLRADAPQMVRSVLAALSE